VVKKYSNTFQWNQLNFTLIYQNLFSATHRHIKPKNLHFLGKMFGVLALFDKFSFVRTATAGHTSFTKNLFQMFHTHFFVIDWFTTFFTSIDGILQHEEEEQQQQRRRQRTTTNTTTPKKLVHRLAKNTTIDNREKRQ